jgi:hypothetical protein
MSKVQFGIVIPADALDKVNRSLYMGEVNRLLNYVKSNYHGAWLIDHLQFEDEIIKTLWTQERATFEGKYYRIKEAYCEPKPDPVPTIMVGAFCPSGA